MRVVTFTTLGARTLHKEGTSVSMVLLTFVPALRTFASLGIFWATGIISSTDHSNAVAWSTGGRLGVLPGAFISLVTPPMTPELGADTIGNTLWFAS